MDINLVWDSSVSSAPSGFETAIEAAADYLDGLIQNNITVNVDVGWGEDLGEPLSSGDLGLGGPDLYAPGYTYAQLTSLLTENALTPMQQAAYADLPATDPTNGGTFYLSAAQDKAFGLIPANGTEADGAVGFSSSANWDYDPNDRAIPGEYDLIGVAEQELTHALGRIYGLGTLFGSGNYSVMDLFRYSAANTLELTAGQPAYLSLNDGTTDLANYATATDDSDWASTTGPDSFDAFIGPGEEYPVSAADIAELNAIGFAAVPCFLRGGRVLTPSGERAVETLAVGDQVVTEGGRIAPVAWIGERRIDCRGHPAGEKVWPVRIRAGAFAAGKPARDLLLSPDHAVFCEGVLIPVQHLVNGATVVQQPRTEVHYWHIELDRHDILLAEALEVESYVEDGNRWLFANGNQRTAHPVAARPSPVRCAPCRTGGAEVEAARRLLLERAFELGWRVGPRPGFRLFAGGRPIAAEAIAGDRHRFVLPPGAREVQVFSATGVPAWLDPASLDRRRLGASIWGIWLDGAALALDQAEVLARGFHPPERSPDATWRWTDGAATLRLPVADHVRKLELLVRDVMRSWIGTESEPSALAA